MIYVKEYTEYKSENNITPGSVVLFYILLQKMDEKLYEGLSFFNRKVPGLVLNTFDVSEDLNLAIKIFEEFREIIKHEDKKLTPNELEEKLFYFYQDKIDKVLYYMTRTYNNTNVVFKWLLDTADFIKGSVLSRYIKKGSTIIDDVDNDIYIKVRFFGNSLSNIIYNDNVWKKARVHLMGVISHELVHVSQFNKGDLTKGKYYLGDRREVEARAYGAAVELKELGYTKEKFLNDFNKGKNIPSLNLDAYTFNFSRSKPIMSALRDSVAFYLE